MTSEKQCRRWYLAGCAWLALFGVGYLAGAAQTFLAASRDPELTRVFEAMRAQRTDMPLLRPTLLELRSFFSLSFSVLLLALCAASLAGGRAGPGVARIVATTNALTLALLGVLGLWLHVLPAIVTGFSGAIVFGIAARRTAGLARRPG